MRGKNVCTIFALCLTLLCACQSKAAEGPRISEVMPFKDRAVESVDFYGDCQIDGERTEVLCTVTEQEDVQYILDTLRALEPLSYNYGGLDGGGSIADGAYFIFNLKDGRCYTIAYLPQVTNWYNKEYDECASLENDMARINVPFYQDFLNTIAEMNYENTYVRNPDGTNNVVIPHFGYSEPGDPPLDRYPYSGGTTPRP